MDRHLSAVYLVLLSFQAVLSAAEQSPEKILIDRLLVNYTPTARPVRDPSTSILVNLTFMPLTLEEIDEKLETMTMKGILRMRWIDEYLAWDKEDHFGMERIILDQNLVWHPDVVVYNGVGSMNSPIQTEQNKVIVNQNSTIVWDAEGTYRVSCPLVMTWFPFDEQECWINISNNKYTLKEVHPVLVGVPDSSYTTQNGHWRIQEHRVDNRYSPEGVFKSMGILTRVKRHPSFYLMNMVVPSLLLTVLSNCLYLIPPQTSDRVAVGTTLVLAYTVFITRVMDSTPSSFTFVPYITIFLLIAMVLSALAVVISIVVLRLSRADHTDMDEKEDITARSARAKLIFRIDVSFFFLHLAVFICLCLSVSYFLIFS